MEQWNRGQPQVLWAPDGEDREGHAKIKHAGVCEAGASPRRVSGCSKCLV